jgi:branched-subunit amino acid aminotransferase/4-amino-4-deoxychorismate lyase
LEHGFTVEERTISPVDLSSFDSAFLTSTSSKIVPICSIDDHQFSISDELKALMKAFEAYCV